MCDTCLGLLAENDQLQAELQHLRRYVRKAEAKAVIYEEIANDVIEELKEARKTFTAGL